MIGHEKILDDLKDLARRGALGHGYIFHGPSMVGKKLLARTFAEYLERSAAVDAGRPEKTLSDYHVIETGEAGSIGIDAVREIKNFLWQKPNVSLRRMLVVNDAEMLTTEAQNALLKVTEEPPASSLLILITSDIESIMPTIVSRLPKIYVAPVRAEVIATWLQNAAVAKRSFGKPGLAVRMMNDAVFQGQIEVAEKLLKSSVTTRRDVIKKIIEPEDFNFRAFLDVLLIVLASRVKADASDSASAISIKTAGLFHKALALYDREANFSLNPRLQLEALLA